MDELLSSLNLASPVALERLQGEAHALEAKQRRGTVQARADREEAREALRSEGRASISVPPSMRNTMRRDAATRGEESTPAAHDGLKRVQAPNAAHMHVLERRLRAHDDAGGTAMRPSEYARESVSVLTEGSALGSRERSVINV